MFEGLGYDVLDVDDHRTSLVRDDLNGIAHDFISGPSSLEFLRELVRSADSG